MNVGIMGKQIGTEHKPFIIAEMSGNHNQSLDRALEIVDAAAQAGADALKIQTYTADTMTLDLDTEGFVIDDPASLWFGNSLYDLYRKAYTPWEWHKPIFDRCKERGIIGFSTPFDETAVDFLEELDAPCYKIASFENTDIPLIRKVAMTGKPVIVSTGMASLSIIDDLVRELRDYGCREIVLLKCTSSYPATPENSNIRTIPYLREAFRCLVGLSDHTLGLGVAVASVSLGVSVIEKHFTLSRADGGVDSEFSLEPEEMERLVTETARAWQSLGQVCFGASQAEEKSLQYRRSIYVVENMKAGDIFSARNIRIIRPGYGLPAKYYDVILGKRVSQAVPRGTPLTWDLLG